MTDKAEFRVTVESPFGNQPTQQFTHFLNKVANEAKARWNIEITVERVDE